MNTNCKTCDGCGCNQTTKIRIGNDIVFNVALDTNRKFDSVNIKSIKCVLINTTLCGHCHHRFPCEPKCDEYKPNCCNLNTCGYHTYNHDPHFCPSFGHYHDGMWRGHCYCDPFHPHHFWGEYPGFGIVPGFYHNHYHCRFGRDFCPHMDYFVPVGHVHRDPHHYICPVKALYTKNRFQAYFPAEDQLRLGTYKMVVVAQVYEPGYKLNDLRTITIDHENLFELVDSSDGATGDVILTVGTNKYPVADNTIAAITLNGPESLTTGESGVITATTSPTNTMYAGVTWTASDDSVTLDPTADSISVAKANAPKNSISGESVVTVIANAANSAAIATHTIKIHNYATKVLFGGYGNTVTLKYGESLEGGLFVLRENGDKDCTAGNGPCGANPIATASLDPGNNLSVKIEPVVVDNTTDSSKESDIICDCDDVDICNCGDRCPNKKSQETQSSNTTTTTSKLVLTNINSSSEIATETVTLTSNAKDSEGLPVTTVITVVCLPKES